VLGILQSRTPQAKTFSLLLLLFSIVQVSNSSNTPSVGQPNNKASLVENSFRRGGALVVGPSLMEISFSWTFHKDRLLMRNIKANLRDFEKKLAGSITDNTTLVSLTTEVEDIIKNIDDKNVVLSQLTHELALSFPKGKAKRSALAWIGEIILGIQNENQRRQIKKLAHASVDITKNLKLDETAIEEMENFVNNFKVNNANYIRASALINNMSFKARRVLHNFSAKLDFLRGLLKGEILFQKLEVEQYAQLMSSTQKEVNNLNLRWIESSLLEVPFTYTVGKQDIEVSFYITTQSIDIPEMEYFIPFEGVLRYNNSNHWILSNEHKAVAFDKFNRWSVSLTQENLSECEHWKHNLICPHLRAVSRKPSSCLEARYTKNISLVLHFCEFTHSKITSTWMMKENLLKHVGAGEPGLVFETCLNSTKTYSDTAIKLLDNCFYDTSTSRFFPSTIHHFNIVLDKSFASNIHIHKLTLQAQHKLLSLNIGHVQTHNIDYYSSMNNLKWAVIPALITVTLALLGLATWVCYIISSHRKVLASICAASVNPEEFFATEAFNNLFVRKQDNVDASQKTFSEPQSRMGDLIDDVAAKHDPVIELKLDEIQPKSSLSGFLSRFLPFAKTGKVAKPEIEMGDLSVQPPIANADEPHPTPPFNPPKADDFTLEPNGASVVDE